MRMDLSHDFSGSTRRNIMRWCNDQMKTNKSTLNGIALFFHDFLRFSDPSHAIRMPVPQIFIAGVGFQKEINK